MFYDVDYERSLSRLTMPFFNEIRLTEEEFMEQLDAIIESIHEDTKTVWIIDHKAAFIPAKLYEELISLAQSSHA